MVYSFCNKIFSFCIAGNSLPKEMHSLYVAIYLFCIEVVSLAIEMGFLNNKVDSFYEAIASLFNATSAFRVAVISTRDESKTP